ncbi:MAG: hypothetical protein AzoDbin1_04099 [Azoarcus sp.]|nr:hypothetical protein [Azoarcus sp.]
MSPNLSFIPADAVVDVARLRVARIVTVARETAEALRAGQIDWLYAFNRISEKQAEVNTVCYTLVELLGDLRHVAPIECGQVETLRAATQVELQALQTKLRETCLFNGPVRRVA